MEDLAQPMKKWPVRRHLAQTVKYVVEDGEYEKPNGSTERQPQERLWSRPPSDHGQGPANDRPEEQGDSREIVFDADGQRRDETQAPQGHQRKPLVFEGEWTVFIGLLDHGGLPLEDEFL